jgi:c-di-GMP-binding flagellar brake protein YcgR
MQFLYQEKRQDTRTGLSVPIRYQIRGTQEFGSTITKNISSGGLSFTLDKFIKPQTNIIIDINLLSRNINSIAAVRWAGNLPHSNKYQLGLEFIEIATADKLYISDYVGLKNNNL